MAWDGAEVGCTIEPMVSPGDEDAVPNSRVDMTFSLQRRWWKCQGIRIGLRRRCCCWEWGGYERRSIAVSSGPGCYRRWN